MNRRSPLALPVPGRLSPEWKLSGVHEGGGFDGTGLRLVAMNLHQGDHVIQPTHARGRRPEPAARAMSEAA
jgi:hypothetical protein